MKTTIELPDDLFRSAKARAALQGRSLKEMVADGLRLLMQTQGETDVSLPSRRVSSKTDQPLVEEATEPEIPVRKRGSAGAWARQFAGVANLASGESTDDVRMDHYRKKYNI